MATKHIRKLRAKKDPPAPSVLFLVTEQLAYLTADLAFSFKERGTFSLATENGSQRDPFRLDHLYKSFFRASFPGRASRFCAKMSRIAVLAAAAATLVAAQPACTFLIDQYIPDVVQGSGVVTTNTSPLHPRWSPGTNITISEKWVDVTMPNNGLVVERFCIEREAGRTPKPRRRRRGASTGNMRLRV